MDSMKTMKSMKANENGDVIETLLIMSIFAVACTIVFAMLGSSIFGSHKATATVQKFEQWSVANPHHPLSYTASLEKIEASTIDESLTGYLIHRPSTNILCFKGKVDKDESYAISLETMNNMPYKKNCK